MNAYAARHGRSKPDEPKVIKTPESFASVRKMVESVRLQHAEFKRSQQKGAAVEMPLTPEKREDIRKMLALPDRGDVTFEEREYRSKQAAKLED